MSKGLPVILAITAFFSVAAAAGRADGDWELGIIATGFAGASEVCAADIDGDGDQDVVGAAEAAHTLAWCANEDADRRWTEHIISQSFSGARDVYTTDIDGDGDQDILCAAGKLNTVAWWSNDDGIGETWTQHLIVEDFERASDVKAADFDNDGDLDVLGSSEGLHLIMLYEYTDGGGLNFRHCVGTNYNNVLETQPVDIDGDGDLDVVGAGFYEQNIAWWENIDGFGHEWSYNDLEGSGSGLGSGACTVHAGDLDGDGDNDIIAHSLFWNRIPWWENLDGVGYGWTCHYIDQDCGGISTFKSIMAVDIDADGDTDILGTNAGLKEICFWENETGEGTSWSKRFVSTACLGAMSACAADIDGDGTLDVVGVGYDWNVVAWWRNAYAGPAVVDLDAAVVDEGLLVEWRLDGRANSLRVLRGAEDPVPVSGDLCVHRGSWLDREVESGGVYVYRLEVTGDYGLTELYGPTEPVVMPGTARGLTLYDPYPSPARNEVALEFELPDSRSVRLVVYDMAGRQVAVPATGDFAAGRHSVAWNTAAAAVGVYLVRLECGEAVLSRRFIIAH